MRSGRQEPILERLFRISKVSNNRFRTAILDFYDLQLSSEADSEEENSEDEGSEFSRENYTEE